MKLERTVYWIATGLFSAMMLMTAMVYLTQPELTAETFRSLGFPSFLIMPLAIAKILGVIAILTKFSPFLKNLAYAGFFFDFLLALGAHLESGDGKYLFAVAALVLLAASFTLDRMLYEPST